jgi:hypothetical protein
MDMDGRHHQLVCRHDATNGIAASRSLKQLLQTRTFSGSRRGQLYRTAKLDDDSVKNCCGAIDNVMQRADGLAIQRPLCYDAMNRLCRPSTTTTAQTEYISEFAGY